jgi:sialic acid synthase SpsE
MKNDISINKNIISLNSPTYFIADIASNHDSDLERAKDLIYQVKEAGGDAVKFQHFLAEKIVSDKGFKDLKTGLSHQSTWKKSIFDIYKQYECNREWTDELISTAKKAEIDFFTTPYDDEALEIFNQTVPAYKIGSGDITWIEFIEKIATLGKPVLLATGASTIEDVKRAMDAILKHTKDVILMQCNTNYTGSLENFKYIQLNVLKLFENEYPDTHIGLSDHTPGHATVLGAIALGARCIEKHFTDDNNRTGPDHPFSMSPASWREMIDRSRELEVSLGLPVKKVEENEKDTIIVQRRAIRFKHDCTAGHTISHDDIEMLRPCPKNSLQPYELDKIIGKKLKINKLLGENITMKDIK